MGSGQTAYILRAPASLSKCRIQVQLDEKGESKETHCVCVSFEFYVVERTTDGSSPF